MSDKKLLAKALIIGTLFGLLFSTALTALSTVVIKTSGLLPPMVTNYIMLGVLSVGTMFGGLVSSRITKSKGLIIGAFTGIFTFVLVTVIALTKGTDNITIMTLLRFLTLTIFGSIGGILGVNRRDKLKI